ncbi:MAG TPA: glycoside hydrolase family 13 protein [Rudaea sp.]|nr:glycoside hydrolase family 13 protein [Rudaea sp.]
MQVSRRVVDSRVRRALFALVPALLAGCAAPTQSTAVRLQPAAAAPACAPAPIAGPLFLRGAMTHWALDDDYTFQYQCDTYVLNVDLTGVQSFRITDAAQSPAASFGGAQGATTSFGAAEALTLRNGSDAGGAGTLSFTFSGKHTIRLRFEPSADHAGHPTITIGAQDFSDPAATPVTDTVALSVRFDSRDLRDKAPFGATVAGTDVDYGIEALPGVRQATLLIEKRRLEGPQEVLEYADVARVPMTRSAQGDHERWQARYHFADIGIYGYSFEIEVGDRKFVYQNNRDTIYWTREKGSGGVGRIEGSTDPLHRIRRFRQTVYRADYHVPEWARDAVFYYIFPERFRNGDRRNDPKPGPNTFHDKSVEVHRNWLDKPWMPRSGDGSDDLYGNDFFGGDLAGIIAKLDYVAALGANTLYLTPIFEAASNHKYDTADYRHIDPHFGTDQDFERLAREARKRGIRVVLDTSLNHSGSDSIYFDRWAKYPGLGAFDGGKIQTDSSYADWYHFDPAQTDPDRQYRGWVGARDLPELNKASPSYRQFAFGAPDSIMNLWLDRGAAGWRMDVAPWVPDDFWREWRAAVKQHRPDALTVAETQFEAAKFFLGDEFDSTMNYIFRNAVQDYANGADARKIYRNIELMRENYPPQAFYALMNLLSTHDSARALFDFGFRDAGADPAMIRLAKQRLRLAVFFQMTFPGAPAVLYGDEAGVTGGDDPYNRVTYPWTDLGGKPDTALLADYKALIRMRKDHPVLRHGSIEAPAFIDDHVIVLLRRDADRWAVTATNNDSSPHEITVALPTELRAAILVDVRTGKRINAESGKVTFTVPALFGTVLENR